MTRRQPRRIKAPVGAVVLYPRPPVYARRWHRVADWARDSTLGDLTYVAPPSSRTAGWRGEWVYDLRDDEEAEESGIRLDELPEISDGPDRRRGGVRRVSIRFYTWVYDEEFGMSDPQWITTGWGMSARGAARRHRRWIRDYDNALGRGIESRKLVATAMEIYFWTAGESANYV